MFINQNNTQIIVGGPKNPDVKVYAHFDSKTAVEYALGQIYEALGIGKETDISDGVMNEIGSQCCSSAELTGSNSKTKEEGERVT